MPEGWVRGGGSQAAGTALGAAAESSQLEPQTQNKEQIVKPKVHLS